jgi:uncharacterized surface protein with fasciclin (FAS1) repeats
MFSKLHRRGSVILGIAALSLASAGIAAASVPPSSEPMGTEPAASEPMASAGPTGVACAAVPTEGEGSVGGMADDPVGTAASNNPLLTTLVSAVGAAGLVDTLNTGGPFTVFAPINTAFAKIPTDTLNGVLADTDALTSILTYHVIPE